MKTAVLRTDISLSKILILAGIGALICLFLTYYLSVSEPDIIQGDHPWLIAGLFGAMLLIGLEWMSSMLDKLIPWQSGAGNRLFVGFILVAVVVFGMILFAANLSFTPFDRTDERTIYDFLMIKLAILSTLFSLIYAVVYFARYSYKSFATMQIETIRQERKQIDLQLKALKSQLSPHFLFNSLNSVSTLIYQENPDADVFVRQLALMYQYVLDSYDRRLVPLSEEINFAKAYGDLLQTRFGNSLEVVSSVDEALLETKVPPVTLQMLVENAVKHNVMDDQRKLQICISNDDEYLLVVNNITEKNNKAKSHQIGLKNIASRYQLLTGKKTVVDQGDSFTVKLPIIQ